MGTVLQRFHHLDGAFLAFTGTIVGGLTGHAIFSPSRKNGTWICFLVRRPRTAAGTAEGERGLYRDMVGSPRRLN